MEIIKSNNLVQRKCDYGNFELIPEKGWMISRSFVDYESKLLVVSIRIIDESKWIDNGKYGKSIPSRQYIIDLNNLKILEPDEWKKRFNYDKTEFISADGKYKMITQRVHKTHVNSDFIEEDMYDLSTNTLMVTGGSVAFSEWKRENHLESLYRSEREKEEARKKLDAKLTIEQYHCRELAKLGILNPVVCYFSDYECFRLSFKDSRFILEQAAIIPAVYKNWHLLDFKTKITFQNLDEFWDRLIENPNWYLNYLILESQSELSSVLAKYIIGFFNHLRKDHRFTQEEYERIHRWENAVRNDDFKPIEFKQWCSNCKKEVRFNGRYPKYICRDCASKDIFALSGEEVRFCNIDFAGGLRIRYVDNNDNVIREDETQISCDCIIDNKLFYAQEARFGGVVIQKKDE
jgi:hypothetical protein